MAQECYESDFELIDVLECDLAFLAKGAAFLALVTLEYKNTDFS